MAERADGADQGEQRRRRLLFVSGEGYGGAPRSTLELASKLAALNDIRVVVGDRRGAPAFYQAIVNASIKMGDLGDLMLAPLATRVGGRATAVQGPVPVVRSPIAATRGRFEARHWRPDVVIANSLPRIEMRWLNEYIDSEGIPFVIYAREEHAVTHFSVTGLRPTLAMANSQGLTDQISAHHPCRFIPSMVDTAATSVASTFEEVLTVNPGLDSTVLEIARNCPNLDFLVQESWPLRPAELRELLRAVDALPNVRFRHRVSGPALFETAKLLLITAEAGRPRIVAEAHANGIPVLAPDFPSLREIVGTGGVLFDPGATPSGIAAVLRDICRPPVHDSLRRAALTESEAEDRDPATVLRMFEEVIAGVLDPSNH